MRRRLQAFREKAACSSKNERSSRILHSFLASSDSVSPGESQPGVPGAFHPLAGRHLSILFERRYGSGGLGHVYICDGGEFVNVTLPESFTDRGPIPEASVTVFRECGGTSRVPKLAGSWLLLVIGGGPTVDEPEVTFAVPADRNTVGHAMTFRVAASPAMYEYRRGRGAQFLTPPAESAWEVRDSSRDPDGHILEISQAK